MILRYQIMNLEMKGVLWISFKVWFNLTLIRNLVVVWDRFPMLNNLWRFVSLKDFPSSIFLCLLCFYLFFSSGILVTEVLSASSTLVLLSSACDVCAMTQDSADCDTTAAGAGANCLPVPGVWEALLPEQSSDNVWGTLDSMTGLFILPTSCGLLPAFWPLWPVPVPSHCLLSSFCPSLILCLSYPKASSSSSPTRWTPLMYIPVKRGESSFTEFLHLLRLPCGIVMWFFLFVFHVQFFHP